jgi:probable F420-dependent oxidoreductase
MRFGIVAANISYWEGPDALAAARTAEASGFDSLWTFEHVVYPDEYTSPYPGSPDGRLPMPPSTPIPDPLIWLSYIASATTTLRLATGIIVLPQRNPLVLAKELATLDRLSGGRLLFGIGVGWLKEEFEALGVPWEQRGARADEYVAALRALWAGDGASFHGRFVSFDQVSSNPKPTQASIPVVVGSFGRAGARRAGRLGDGFLPAAGSTAELAELIDVMRDSAVQHGRDPSRVEITTFAQAHLESDPVGAVEELAALGVDRVLMVAGALGDRPAADAIEALADQVVKPGQR